MPHQEKSDEIYVAIKKDYHNDMLNFRKQINKREQVIGWFSTTSSGKPECVSDNCSLIHEFYSNESTNSPIHVVVDTALPPDAQHLNIKAYVSKPLIVGMHALGNIFQELRLTVDLSSSEAEVLCVYQMIHGQKGSNNQEQLWQDTTTTASIANTQESFKHSSDLLLQTISRATALISAAPENQKLSNPALGVALADALDILHSVKKADFDATFQRKADSMLMISYITALTKTQLVVAEKLNAVL